jgi:hypothetical protein
VIKLYTESNQRTLPFQSPKLSITQREFIWTPAKTRYEINDAVTLHNEALTVLGIYIIVFVSPGRGRSGRQMTGRPSPRLTYHREEPTPQRTQRQSNVEKHRIFIE